MELYSLMLAFLLSISEAFAADGFFSHKDSWSGNLPYQGELALAMKSGIPSDSDGELISQDELEAFVLAIALENYMTKNEVGYQLLDVEECVCDVEEATCLVTAEYIHTTCAREGQGCQDGSVQNRITCSGLFEIDSLTMLDDPVCFSQSDSEDQDFEFDHGDFPKFLVPQPPTKKTTQGMKKWGSSSGHIHPLKKWGASSGSIHPLSVRDWNSKTGRIHPLSQRSWDPCTGGVHPINGKSKFPCNVEAKRIFEEMEDEDEPDF